MLHMTNTRAETESDSSSQVTGFSELLNPRFLQHLLCMRIFGSTCIHTYAHKLRQAKLADTPFHLGDLTFTMQYGIPCFLQSAGSHMTSSMGSTS